MTPAPGEVVVFPFGTNTVLTRPPPSTSWVPKARVCGGGAGWRWWGGRCISAPNPLDARRRGCRDVPARWVGMPLPAPTTPFGRPAVPGSPAPGPCRGPRAAAVSGRARHGAGSARSRRVSWARRRRGRRDAAAPLCARGTPAASAVWAPCRRVLAWRLEAGAPRVRVPGSTEEGRAWGTGVGAAGASGRGLAPLRKARVKAGAAGARGHCGVRGGGGGERCRGRGAGTRGDGGMPRAGVIRERALVGRAPGAVLPKILQSLQPSPLPGWRGRRRTESWIPLCPFKPLGRPLVFPGEGREGGGRSTRCCGQRCLEVGAMGGWGQGACDAVSWQRAFCSCCWPDKHPLLSSLEGTWLAVRGCNGSTWGNNYWGKERRWKTWHGRSTFVRVWWELS